MARRQYLFAAVAADVVDAAPPPAAGHGPIVPTPDVYPWEGDEAVGAGKCRARIIGDRRDAVAGAMGKAEIRRIHVVPEDAVAGKLVQHHAPIRRDPDRIGNIASIGEGKLHEADTVSQGVARALRIDGISQAAVIDRHRECRAVEVGRDREAQVAHHAEEAVAMVIRIDRREVVGARDVVEIERRRLGRQDRGRRRLVGEEDEASRQVLLACHDRPEIEQRDRIAQQVERGAARAGQIGRIGGLGHGIAVEHQAHGAVGQRAQVEHRSGLRLDEGAPVQRGIPLHRQ